MPIQLPAHLSLCRALLTVDNSTSTSTDTTDDDESDKAWFALLGLLILPIGLLAACFCVNQQKKKDEEYAKQPDLYKEPLVKEKPIYQENIAYVCCSSFSLLLV